MANIVDPDDSARYEPPILKSHCLQRYLVGSAELKMGQRMTKPTKWHVRPAKTQISLGIMFGLHTFLSSIIRQQQVLKLWTWRNARRFPLTCIFKTYMSTIHWSIQTLFYTKTITKTCLYNFDPLKPHLYIVKLGFTGIYLIFLITAQKHKLWILVRTGSLRRSPRRF